MIRRLLPVALLAVAACTSTPSRPAASPSPSATTVTPPAPEPTRTPVVTRPSPSPSASPSASPPASPLATTTIHRTYAFPVRGCAASYGHSHHDYPATDVFAARGCAFVAVVAGRVDEVSYVDRWDPATNRGADRGGLSVSIVGDDGVRYYGSHLTSIAAGIRPGVRVSPGTLLGRVGNTGSARGIATHVHFGVSWPSRPGIWWVRRGLLYPWPYLDSWRAGGSRSPAAEVRRLRAAAGTDAPPCRSYC